MVTSVCALPSLLVRESGAVAFSPVTTFPKSIETSESDRRNRRTTPTTAHPQPSRPETGGQGPRTVPSGRPPGWPGEGTLGARWGGAGFARDGRRPQAGALEIGDESRSRSRQERRP